MCDVLKRLDWNVELVDQLEWHWAHHLRRRLEGLTDDEYFWQPVPGCWTLSRRRESPAAVSLGTGEFTMDYAKPPHEREPVTTIAWRLAHLIDVFGLPTASHFDGMRANDPVDHYWGTAQGALRQIDKGHDAWVSDLRSLGAVGLARRRRHRTSAVRECADGKAHHAHPPRGHPPRGGDLPAAGPVPVDDGKAPSDPRNVQ